MKFKETELKESLRSEDFENERDKSIFMSESYAKLLQSYSYEMVNAKLDEIYLQFI